MNATPQANLGRLVAKGLALAGRMTLSYLADRARTGAAPTEGSGQAPQFTHPDEPVPARPAKVSPSADPVASAAMRASQDVATSSWASRVYNPW